MEQKKSSNQVVSILYTLGKEFFLILLFLRIFETLLFRQSKKVSSIPLSLGVFFAFLEKRRPTRCCLCGKKKKKKIVFHM